MCAKMWAAAGINLRHNRGEHMLSKRLLPKMIAMRVNKSMAMLRRKVDFDAGFLDLCTCTSLVTAIAQQEEFQGGGI